MVRRVFGVVLLWLCVVFTQALAEEVTYSALEKTPLKLKSIDEYGVASFKGSIKIDGDYEVELDAYDDEPLEPKVSFHPSSVSMKYLPTPHSSKPEYDTLPNNILFTNSDKAAKLLLDTLEYKELMDLKRKYDSYSSDKRIAELANLKVFRGFAKIKIDSYATAIECDSRWYEARLVSVYKKNDKLVTGMDGHSGC